MKNLELFDKVSVVPENALKEIKGGRLKGFSDINPVWRIKTLTEQFGQVGVGWYYMITNKKIETVGEESVAFVDIELFVKNGDVWSKPIVGTGGSSFVAKEKNGPYMSDECFKMALTDAISVACKALGIGANVYWNTSGSKYQKNKGTKDTTDKITDEQLTKAIVDDGRTVDSVIAHYVKETGKQCSTLKFMKYESKKKLYDYITTNPKKKE